MSISRRIFVRAAIGGAGIAAALPALLLSRGAGAALPAQALFAASPDDAVRAVLGSDRATAHERVRLDIAPMVEVADMVPLSVASDLDEMESITLVADENPTPVIAHYRLDPHALLPYISTRVRLAGSGDVHALVKAGGQLYRASRHVEIGVSGCGDAEPGPQAKPLAQGRSPADGIRVRIEENSEALVVRALIEHPMNPPLPGADGRLRDPGLYIQEVTATLDGRTILSADWSAGVSRSPYLSFKVRQAARGDTIGLAWRDSAGSSGGRDIPMG